mgnify:CR=1 FL=1
MGWHHNAAAWGGLPVALAVSCSTGTSCLPCWPVTLDRTKNYWTVLYSLQVRCVLDLGQGGRIEVSGRILGAGGPREGAAVGCHHSAAA